MLNHAMRSIEAGAAQISSECNFFSLPLCFHQFVRTKLASDAQINMYTASFLRLYKNYRTPSPAHVPILSDAPG